MSSPDFDKKNVDSDQMFDFLHEGSTDKPARPKKTRVRKELVMPIIRKPVPISESGPAGVQSSTLDLPDDDDFDFLNGATQAYKPSSETDLDEDWNEGVHIDDSERESSGIKKLGVALLSVLALAAIGISYNLFFSAQSDPSTASPSLVPVSAPTNTEINSAEPASVDPVVDKPEVDKVVQSTTSTLFDRFSAQLKKIEALMSDGNIDAAEQSIATMDRTVYGYGAAEFSEIELRIARLRAGIETPIGDTDSVAEATAVAATARAEEEARLAEQTRVAEEALAAEQAEQARIAEELQAAEQSRLAQEALAAEQARLAEEALAAEQTRLEQEALAAEQARLEQEALAAEQTRLAEDALAAEQARIAEQAKLAEEARAAQAARLAEEALAAEQERIAAEQILAAEQARLAEEARAAEQALATEQARLAQEASAAEQNRIAEEALAAEQARLLEQAKLEEERRAAEQAQLLEQAQLAETQRLAEAQRLAQAQRQAEAARQAEAERQAELERVAKAAEQDRIAAREAAAAQRLAEQQRTAQLAAQQLAAEQAKIAEESLALATAKAEERIAIQRAQQATERRLAERARLSRERAQAAEIARRQALEAQSQLQITPKPASARISDDDFNFVAGQFVQLKNAVANRDIETVIALTQPSGKRVQQMLQLFQNNSTVEARISNVASRDADGVVVGKLKIQKLVRNSGSAGAVPSELSSITLTSKRGSAGWSPIAW